MLCPWSLLNNAEEAADKAKEESCRDLCEGVLAQNHAARAYETREEERETEPPRRVEIKEEAKGDERPVDGSDGTTVGGDFPMDVDEGAKHLYEQRCDEHRADKARHVRAIDHVVAEEVAKNAYHVGYHTAFLGEHLQGRPALITAIKVDKERGDEERECIDE